MDKLKIIMPVVLIRYLRNFLRDPIQNLLGFSDEAGFRVELLGKWYLDPSEPKVSLEATANLVIGFSRILTSCKFKNSLFWKLDSFPDELSLSPSSLEFFSKTRLSRTTISSGRRYGGLLMFPKTAGDEVLVSSQIFSWNLFRELEHSRFKAKSHGTSRRKELSRFESISSPPESLLSLKASNTFAREDEFLLINPLLDVVDIACSWFLLTRWFLGDDLRFPNISLPELFFGDGILLQLLLAVFVVIS